MRTGLSWVLVIGAITAAACGGKVVVDGSDGSNGGAGGTTSTGTGASTSTGTSTGLSCGPMSCGAGSDGSCTCQAMCNGQNLEADCAPIQGGASCTCIENGIKIAVCIQEGAASCNIVSECCAAQFFGQGG